MPDNLSEGVPVPGVASRSVDAGRGWDWIAEAFALFKKQPGMWILLVIILTVLCIIPVIGSIVALLLLPVFGGGFMLGCRALDRDGVLDIAHLFAGFKTNTSSLVLLGVFNLVANMALFSLFVTIVGTGAIMAILAGDVSAAGISILSILLAILVCFSLSVPIYMAAWFAPALVVFDNLAPLAALRASFFACMQNLLPFTLYGIVMLVFGMLAAIPFGLGYLVLGPVVVASIYTGYRDIFSAN